MPHCTIHGYYPAGATRCPACPSLSSALPPRHSSLGSGYPIGGRPHWLPPEEPSTHQPRPFEFVEYGWIRDDQGVRISRHVEALEISGHGYLVRVIDTVQTSPAPYPTHLPAPTPEATTFTVLLNLDSLRAVRDAFFDRREEEPTEGPPYR